MKKVQSDVVILGDGMAGMGTALALKEKGLSVTVLGRTGLEGKASVAAAGMLDPLMSLVEPNHPTMNLTLSAFQYFSRFMKKLGGDAHKNFSYEKTGMFLVAANPKEEEKLQHIYEWQRKLKFPVKRMSGENLSKKAPFLTRPVKEALFYPQVGKVDARAMTGSLRKVCLRKGVRFYPSELEPKVEIRGTCVEGVRTREFDFRAHTVVAAMGCWMKSVDCTNGAGAAGIYRRRYADFISERQTGHTQDRSKQLPD